MNVTKNTIELGAIRPANTLRLKTPLTDQQKEWLTAEIDNYVMTTKYLAWFFEMRSKLGDMTEQEVWDEIKANVSMHARGGFDALGVQ